MYRYFFLILLLCTSCTGNEETEPPDEAIATASAPTATRPRVRVVAVEEAAFPLRLRANGTLIARQQAVIKSASGGEIVQLVEEGQSVRKGQLLAQLDDTDLRLQQAELQQQLAEAALKRDELMVRFAGEVGVDSSVTETQLATILAQSGYTRTERALDRIRFQIDQTRIAAPFSGTVADRQVQRYERIGPQTEVCTLIDPGSLEVEFLLLEQEIGAIRPGQTVLVEPVGLTGTTIEASVSIINPQVDENGLVRVRARLRSYGGYRLYTGMNALVSLERTAGRYLTVPKTAVVERSGREVVFTYDSTAAVAKWQYVTVAHENDTHAAISEGLTADAWVIYEGNLNLDHDARVEVVE